LCIITMSADLHHIKFSDMTSKFLTMATETFRTESVCMLPLHKISNGFFSYIKPKVTYTFCAATLDST
jgi:hypothetical protein